MSWPGGPLHLGAKRGVSQVHGTLRMTQLAGWKVKPERSGEQGEGSQSREGEAGPLTFHLMKT